MRHARNACHHATRRDALDRRIALDRQRRDTIESRRQQVCCERLAWGLHGACMLAMGLWGVHAAVLA